MKTSILTLATAAALLIGTADITAQRRGSSDNNATRPSSNTTGSRSPGSRSTATPSQTTRSSSSNREAPRTRPAATVGTGDRHNTHEANRPSRTPATVSRTRETNHRERPQTVTVRRERPIRQYSRNNAAVITKHQPRYISVLPASYTRVYYNGIDYSYYNGNYYRYYNNTYAIVPPPRGIRVAVIPAGFLTIMVKTTPYYYYQGVYYSHDVTNNYYEVTAPPMGAIVPELPDFDVREVVIDGKVYLEYDNVLYKEIVTQYGIQYQVAGTLNN